LLTAEGKLTADPSVVGEVCVKGACCTAGYEWRQVAHFLVTLFAIHHHFFAFHFSRFLITFCVPPSTFLVSFFAFHHHFYQDCQASVTSSRQFRPLSSLTTDAIGCALANHFLIHMSVLRIDVAGLRVVLGVHLEHHVVPPQAAHG
jgi:hypothetical protein